MITCSTDINDIYFRHLQQVFPLRVCARVCVHVYVWMCIGVSVNTQQHQHQHQQQQQQHQEVAKRLKRRKKKKKKAVDALSFEGVTNKWVISCVAMVLVSSRQQRYVYERTEEEDEKCRRRRRKRRMNELAGRQAGKRRNVESIFFLRLRYLSPSRYIYVCSGYVCFMSCFLYHIHCYSILYPSRMRTHREWMIARLLTKNGAVDILKLEYSVHSKCWCWWMVCTFLRFWFQKTNVAISLCINFTSFEFLPKKNSRSISLPSFSSSTKIR